MKEPKQITKSETKNYKLIGRGAGTDLGHCLFMAHRHVPNFDKEVVAYCIEKEFSQNNPPIPSTRISFWKSKK